MATAARRAFRDADTRTASTSDVYLTPPALLAELGPFSLDPCAAPEPRPWPTARVHFTEDEDGLSRRWFGRVFANPPYGHAVGLWLRKMAGHGNGLVLIFNRSDTRVFQEYVLGAAHGLFFIRGRLQFFRASGKSAPYCAGAPSVIAAYGTRNAEVLRHLRWPGTFVPIPRVTRVVDHGMERQLREPLRNRRDTHGN